MSNLNPPYETPETPTPPMTIEQLRVAVAKDVLKLLKMEQIEPRDGVYFYSPNSFVLCDLEAQELQHELLNYVPKCHVCALGLSAISLVRVKDSILGRDLVHDADSVARDELGHEWASIVEAAFEYWAIDSEDGIERVCTLPDVETRERARLIMQTVIETKGDEDRLRDLLFTRGDVNA